MVIYLDKFGNRLPIGFSGPSSDVVEAIFDHEDLTDVDLEFLSGKSNFLRLTFNSSGQFTDVGLFHLTKLSKLQELHFLCNGVFTDVGLGYVSKMRFLKSLQFRDSGYFTRDGLQSLTGLRKLRFLNINNVSGFPVQRSEGIPIEVDEFSFIRKCYIYN